MMPKFLALFLHHQKTYGLQFLSRKKAPLRILSTFQVVKWTPHSSGLLIKVVKHDQYGNIPIHSMTNKHGWIGIEKTNSQVQRPIGIRCLSGYCLSPIRKMSVTRPWNLYTKGQLVMIWSCTHAKSRERGLKRIYSRYNTDLYPTAN